MVLWWYLGSYHLNIWTWTDKSTCFIVRTDVVRAVKITLFVFRLWIFFRSPGKLLWKEKNHRVSCFGIDFAASRVICEIRPGCSELYLCGSWTLQGWRSSPGSLVSWPQWNFFSYIQLEPLLSIYGSCLSFSNCSSLWGARLSSWRSLQVGRARVLWDPPETVLYPDWTSPAPFSFAHRTSPPALTNLVASTILFQVFQLLKIPGQDYCRNNCRNGILNLCLSLEHFYTNSFSCCSLSKNLSPLLRKQNLLSSPKMHCL